jgi:hypothetical protein
MSVYTIGELMDAVMESLRGRQSRAELVARIERPRNPADRRRALRGFYGAVMPEILKTSSTRWGLDPYEVDWLRVFTPEQFALWQDIRCAGVVLYPLLPVQFMVLDFAHPVTRVAVECADVESEAAILRKRHLVELGWTVYQFTPAQCVAPDIWDDERAHYVPDPQGSAYLLGELAKAKRLAARPDLEAETDDSDIRVIDGHSVRQGRRES